MTSTAITARTTTTRTLWRPTAVAAVVAAGAATAVAAIAQQAGASLEIDGEAIPLMGFFQMVLICSAIGLAAAVGIRRWSAAPRQTFVRTAVALTALSFIPDLLVSAGTSTRITLMVTHIVAAVIVVPVVAKRLSTGRG